MNFDPKIDPTSELLGVWARWVLYAVDEEQTRDPGEDRRWGDAETQERNAVADAEMLECVLLPGTAVEGLMLDRVLAPSRRTRETLADARKALSPPRAESGQVARAFALLLSRIDDYLRTHRDDDARPSFRADGYVYPVEGEFPEGGFACDFVDAYSLAVSVCVQTLTILRALGDSDTRAEILQAWRGEGLPVLDLDEIVKLAEERLTAAMHGLKDSFVAIPSTDEQWSYVAREPPGLDADGTLFPHGPEMDRVRSQVERYLHIDLGDDRPWECGFTWGRARNVISGHGWPALEAPYLYSTVVALDGIRDVANQGVLSSDILTPEQASLAAELSFCASAAVRHWEGLAMACQPLSGVWRLEDVPWRTPDYDENEYYTLLVARILVGDGRSGTLADPEIIDRLVRIAEELAQRGRITRHPVVDGGGDLLTGRATHQRTNVEGEDPALRLHDPGKLLRLDPAPGSDGIAVSLRIYDYAPQLLKLVSKLAQATPSDPAQERLRAIIEATWRHLAARRARSSSGTTVPGRAWASWPPQGLWNMRGLHVEGGFGDDNSPWVGVNSWYMTERVVEALVALVQLRQARPGSAPQSSQLLDELMAELEWRIAQTATTKRAPFLKKLAELHTLRTEIGASATLGDAQELLGKVIAASQTNGGS
ncbi:MAG: hypothetical protein ACYDA6_01680 [Solirubrobacteraceae bacterium]